MNTRTILKDQLPRSLHNLNRRSSFLSFVLPAANLAAALLLLPSLSRAGGVVTNCTEAALRAAMVGGGTVSFACDGTITLASTIVIALDTALDATGRQVTISGGDYVRVFDVQTNVTFALNRLTVAHGRNTNGAGILNEKGTVNATNTIFDSNCSPGAAGASGAVGQSCSGGAVANSGVINLVNCSFTNNSAVGGAGSWGDYYDAGPGFAGGTAAGGAIWNSGSLTANGCTFAGNSATGGQGGGGGVNLDGYYGTPGNGGDGGGGLAGGIFNTGVALHPGIQQGRRGRWRRGRRMRLLARSQVWRPRLTGLGLRRSL